MNETKRYWDLFDWNKEELVNHIIDLEKYSNEDKKEIRNLKQLQNNWNELEEWLEKEHKRNISWYGSLTHHDKQYYFCKFSTTKNVLDNVQDKMQELEQGKDVL